jgi:hypothetical protein
MVEQETPDDEDLIKRVLRLLEPKHIQVEEQLELIVAVLMILLDYPPVKSKFYFFLSTELSAKIDGKLHDKICAVINKTHIMKGEKADIADDTALELIRDYLLEFDEFIFHKNEDRILRNTKQKQYLRKTQKA